MVWLLWIRSRRDIFLRTKCQLIAENMSHFQFGQLKQIKMAATHKLRKPQTAMNARPSCFAVFSQWKYKTEFLETHAAHKQASFRANKFGCPLATSWILTFKPAVNSVEGGMLTCGSSKKHQLWHLLLQSLLLQNGLLKRGSILNWNRLGPVSVTAGFRLCLQKGWVGVGGFLTLTRETF